MFNRLLQQIKHSRQMRRDRFYRAGVLTAREILNAVDLILDECTRMVRPVGDRSEAYARIATGGEIAAFYLHWQLEELTVRVCPDERLGMRFLNAAQDSIVDGLWCRLSLPDESKSDFEDEMRKLYEHFLDEIEMHGNREVDSLDRIVVDEIAAMFPGASNAANIENIAVAIERSKPNTAYLERAMAT